MGSVLNDQLAFLKSMKDKFELTIVKIEHCLLQVTYTCTNEYSIVRDNGRVFLFIVINFSVLEVTKLHSNYKMFG
jgi:hypothetical protein